MKYLATTLLVITLGFSKQSFSCSMYKLTANGKTIVGNNEDYTSPNSQFWFEKGSKNSFGVMYMGLLNNFAQGAINDKGLVFDGFWEPYLEVKNTEGKIDIPIQEAITHIMQTMKNVDEVQAYMSTINLSSLQNSQLVFIDKSGTYLIIEGDEMFIGNEEEKTFSNFYYSQIQSLNDVDLPYFKKGQEFLANTQQHSTLDYCSKTMSSFAQNGIAPTQYTTIYDLDQLTIRIHLFHDFSDYVELSLEKELKKDNHKTMIADLFPANSKGLEHFKKYNNPEHPTLLLEELLGDIDVSEEELVNQGLNNIINQLGYEWLDEIKNAEGAIRVFKYGLTLMPNNSEIHANLGEAYFANNEWNNAIISYAKSLSINPQNTSAIKMIIKAQEKRDHN